ncbi:MAG: hypothetical protein WDN31_10025 [Hyphomicrobium sp.]
MRKRIIPAVCIVAAFSVEARADGVAPAAAGAPAFNWTGYYFGAHLGAGVGRSQFSDPYGPSIYGDTVRAPEAMIGPAGRLQLAGAGIEVGAGGPKPTSRG